MSPKYTMFSFGSCRIISRVTVRPPTPESNTPTGSVFLLIFTIPVSFLPSVLSLYNFSFCFSSVNAPATEFKTCLQQNSECARGRSHNICSYAKKQGISLLFVSFVIKVQALLQCRTDTAEFLFPLSVLHQCRNPRTHHACILRHGSSFLPEEAPLPLLP